LVPEVPVGIHPPKPYLLKRGNNKWKYVGFRHLKILKAKGLATQHPRIDIENKTHVYRGKCQQRDINKVIAIL